MNLFDSLGTEGISLVRTLTKPEGENKYASIWQRYLSFRRAVQLRKSGAGYGTIARFLGVSKGQVVNWLGGRHQPLRRHVMPEVNPDFGYVLGAWFGDGSLSSYTRRSRHYTRLTVKDADFAGAFAESLGKVLGRKRPAQTLRTKDLRYCVSVNNRILYDFLRSCRLRPELARPIINAFAGFFLSGFWDAEGTIDLTKGQHKIQAFNTNTEIMDLVGSALDKLGIHYTRYSKIKDDILLSPRDGKVYHRRHRLIYTIHIQSCCRLRFMQKVHLRIQRKSDRLKMIFLPPNRCCNVT